METPDVVYLGASTISSALETELGKIMTPPGGQSWVPDIIVAIKRVDPPAPSAADAGKPSPMGTAEIRVAVKAGKTVIPTVLRGKTSEGQVIEPGPNEYVVLMAPDKAFRLCIPYLGGYLYI